MKQSSDEEDDTSGRFNSRTLITILSSTIILLVVSIIIFILIRIKTMDKSDEKTVSTILFGSEKESDNERYIH